MNATSMERAGRFGLAIYFVLVMVFLLLPMLLVVPMSISETRYLKFPPSGFTLQWYEVFFASQSWLDATRRSLLIALSSAFVATILGTLAALVLSRGHRGSWLISIAFLGPQVAPVIILALGALLVFSRLNLYGSIPGLVLVHALLALPFVVTLVSGSLRQNGDTLAKAARVLGARPHEAFLHVTFPTIRPAVMSSAIFAFFISFDELVIALFVMGRNETLPMRIWADVRQDLTPVVAAVATLLIIATMVAVMLSELVRQRSAARLPNPSH